MRQRAGIAGRPPRSMIARQPISQMYAHIIAARACCSAPPPFGSGIVGLFYIANDTACASLFLHDYRYAAAHLGHPMTK